MLEPNRAARLINFNARDKNNPHFQEIVDALIKATWKTTVSANDYHAEIERTVQSLTVTHLMNLAANEDAQFQVRAVATESLRELLENIKARHATGETATHYKMTIENIERFLDRPAMPRKTNGNPARTARRSDWCELIFLFPK